MFGKRQEPKLERPGTTSVGVVVHGDEHAGQHRPHVVGDVRVDHHHHLAPGSQQALVNPSDKRAPVDTDQGFRPTETPTPARRKHHGGGCGLHERKIALVGFGCLPVGP